jgi:hypothetical protein
MWGMGIPVQFKNALIFGLSAANFSQPVSQPAEFQFTRFICSLRSTKLLSQIHFYDDSQQDLTGEVDSYEIKGQTRTFVSGDMLYTPVYANGVISGTTGDPEAIKETFTLTRMGPKNTGIWRYRAIANGTISNQGDFNCSYPDERPILEE